MSDINQGIAYLKVLVRRDIESLKKDFGEMPGQEKVSPEVQMKAYLSLTADNIAQLQAQHGPEAGKWFMEMESRKRRSENAKSTV